VFFWAAAGTGAVNIAPMTKQDNSRCRAGARAPAL